MFKHKQNLQMSSRKIRNMNRTLLIMILQKSVNLVMSLLTEIVVFDQVKLKSTVLSTLIISVENVVTSVKKNR